MATTLDECQAIVTAARLSRKNCTLMMETAIYTREFLFIREMFSEGKIGRVQFMRGCHQQEMAGWPGYWEELAAHALRHPCGEPVLVALVEGESRLCCLLWLRAHSLQPRGQVRLAVHGVETALFKIRDQSICFEVTRSLFETARQLFVESFDVYGDKASFEWTRIDGELSIIHEGEKPGRVKIPDYARLLPSPIQHFTTKGVYDSAHASTARLFRVGDTAARTPIWRMNS